MIEKFKNIGFIGLIIYTISIFFSKGGMNIGLAFMIIGVIFLNKKECLKKYDSILKYFFIIILITPFWAIFSDGGISSALKALEKIYRFIPAFLGIFYLDSKIKFKYVLNSLIFSILVNFIGGLIFYSKVNWDFAIRYSSIIKNPLDNGHLASAIIFVLLGGILYFYKEDKKISYFYTFGAFLSFFILILSQGRGAWLAFIAGVGTFISFKINLKKFILISFLLITSIFIITKTTSFKENRYIKRFKSIENYKKDDSSLIRIIMWDGIIDTYKKNIFFGVGRDNLNKWTFQYIKQNNSHKRLNNKNSIFTLNSVAQAGNPHNMYMVALGEMGIMSFGLLFFWGWIYIDCIKVYFNTRKNNYSNLYLGVVCAFTSLYITGLTESSWRNIWKGNLYILIMIIYFSLKLLQERGNNEKNLI